MDSSSLERKVPVRVTAADAATEILILDGSFSRVAVGVGRLDAQLPAGLYKVKLLAGDAVEELLVEVPSELPAQEPRFEIEQPTQPLAFSSSAPLESTSTSHKFQSGPASALSRQKPIRKGSGSQIFLFVRDSLAAGRREPWRGVAICTAEGEQLAELSVDGVFDRKAHYGALHLEVNPGSYLLAVDTKRAWGVLAMAVVTVAGWQTQVFLDARDYQRGTAVDQRRADLEDASIFMTRLGAGFDAASPLLRLSDLARKALVRGRPLLRHTSQFREELALMLEGKFENPMLGLYALHLLLLETERDDALIEDVLKNLRRLGLAEHPDLRACELATREPTPEDRFPEPPMLFASWRLLVVASGAEPALIPYGSLAERIASRLVGSGSWLVWRQLSDAAEKERQREAEPESLSRPRSLPRDLGVLLESGPRGANLLYQLFPPVDDSLGALLSKLNNPIGDPPAPGDDPMLTAQLDLPEPAEAFSPPRPPRQPKHGFASSYLEKTVLQAMAAHGGEARVSELVKSLGLPAATVEATVAALARKKNW